MGSLNKLVLVLCLPAIYLSRTETDANGTRTNLYFLSHRSLSLYNACQTQYNLFCLVMSGVNKWGLTILPTTFMQLWNTPSCFFGSRQNDDTHSYQKYRHHTLFLHICAAKLLISIWYKVLFFKILINFEL